MSKALTMIGESNTPVTRKTPKNWKLATVGSCLEFITDYRGYTPPYVDEGIPVISAENVSDGRIRSITKYVTQKVYQKTTTRGFPEPNDVVFTTEAPFGGVCQIDCVR
ncbi:MAG: hypothetical protein Kow00121_12290 [Elainellaceae cyanobacterium]